MRMALQNDSKTIVQTQKSDFENKIHQLNQKREQAERKLQELDHQLQAASDKCQRKLEQSEHKLHQQIGELNKQHKAAMDNARKEFTSRELEKDRNTAIETDMKLREQQNSLEAKFRADVEKLSL